MTPWKTLSRKSLLERPPFLRVEEHRVKLPDGREIDDWTWVDTPDYAVMAVLTQENRFLCFEQTKYAVPGVSLAPPGGYLEPGEAPLAAAARELREETGYVAERWIELGAYPVDCNRGAGVANLFLAFDAVRLHEPTEDDLEEARLLTLTVPQVRAALAAGRFGSLPWAACFSMALNWLDSHPVQP